MSNNVARRRDFIAVNSPGVALLDQRKNDSQTGGPFQIVVLDEKDVSDIPIVESLSIPRTKHRRTWNRAAVGALEKETPLETNANSPMPEWHLHRVDSIVLGKTSKPDELSFFLAVCFLRWRPCPSIHGILKAHVARYLRRFKVPNVKNVLNEHGSFDRFKEVVANHIIYHLREPQHPYDINRYVKKIVAGLAHQSKPAAPFRSTHGFSHSESYSSSSPRGLGSDIEWLHDRGERGLRVEDAANYPSYTKQHIHAEIRKGKIRSRGVNGSWFIPENEIYRLQNEHGKRRKVSERRRAAIEYLTMKFHLKSETARKAVQRMENGGTFKIAFNNYVSKKQGSD